MLRPAKNACTNQANGSEAAGSKTDLLFPDVHDINTKPRDEPPISYPKADTV
jgi:hypothetical protein